jgi:hypothetical protein
MLQYDLYDTIIQVNAFMPLRQEASNSDECFENLPLGGSSQFFGKPSLPIVGVEYGSSRGNGTGGNQ